MAPNITATQPKAFIGTPIGLPMALCRPISGSGPASLKLSIDWSLYGASTSNDKISIMVNLQQQGTVTSSLDAIRSAYIDNSAGDYPVYLYFQDTQFTAICPPRSIVICPILTGLQQLIIYSEGFITGNIPTTIIHLMNVTREGLYIPLEFDTPVISTFLESRSDPTNSTIYNFAGVNFGTPRSDRVLVLVGCAFSTSAVNIPVLSASQIGGVPVIQASGAGNAHGTGSSYCGIAYAKVPSGNSGTVNITLTNVASGFAFGLYSIVNQNNDAPFDMFGVNGASAPTILNCVLQMPKNSSAFFGANVSSLVFPNWIGANSNWSQLQSDGGVNDYMTGASVNSVVDQVRSVSISANNLVGAAWL